jgi:hypothetical protein
MKNGCMICNEELGYEPQMCCSGFMCGCGGRPIEMSVLIFWNIRIKIHVCAEIV